MGFMFALGISIVGLSMLCAFIVGECDNPEPLGFFSGAFCWTLAIGLAIIGFTADPETSKLSLTPISLWYPAFYVGLGIMVSLVKWYMYLGTVTDRFNLEKTAQLTTPSGKVMHVNDMQGSVLAKYQKWLSNFVIPSARQNKRRIMAWTVFWPATVVWTFISNPMMRFFGACFEFFSGTYQRIANYVFRDIKAEYVAVAARQQELINQAAPLGADNA